MKRKGTVIFFIFPASVVLAFIVLYPIFQTFLLSFQHKVLISPENDRFIGFGHYIEIFKSAVFLHSIFITIIFAFTSVFLKLTFGMIGALMLRVKSKASTFYLSIFMIPWLIPSVVAALTWRWILHDQFGILNYVLETLNLIDVKINWLGTPILALLAVIVVDTWTGLPFIIIVCLAGLQTIPKEWYEASNIDGANALQQFLYITLPGMKHIILVMGTLSFIGTFNSFNIIYTLTGGGPANATNTLVLYIYQMAFTNYDFGMAAALSVVTFIFIMSVVIMYRKKLDKEGEFI
ncbi:carbohydrate ABC transporter permease [Bacillus sp. FJAT-44742]|uniref:carbohydrate ABC transporter permease n=1 Tax=Bacillus sp. FJAT-44742 TaxID=2014005 RepID=UPI000C245779|nr:sugar ABC transporter permease [Bacillus sp. FJAT-44742]